MIDSSALVTDVYGYWPRFEGAYVLSATLDTDSTLFCEYGERTLTLDLHWWLGAADYYPGAPLIFDEKDLHRRIRLAFSVEDVRIHTFEVSHVSIDELGIQPVQGRLECKGGFELSCTFRDAKVLSVEPCDHIGDRISPASTLSSASNRTSGAFPLERPTELNDFFAYLVLCAPDAYPEENGLTNSSAFALAFQALDRFADSTKTAEGREAVLQCKRQLLVAFECYEQGDDVRGSHLVQDVEELFRKARRFITISDE